MSTEPPITPPSTPAPEAPWPPLWARKTGFFVGVALIVWESTLDAAQNLAVYGPALVLTGMPLARGLEKVVDLLAGLVRKP